MHPERNCAAVSARRLSDPGLYSELTAWEHLQFSAALYDMKPPKPRLARLISVAGRAKSDTG